MELWETARSISCNMVVCCPLPLCQFLENCGGGYEVLAHSLAGGSLASAVVGSACRLTAKVHGSRVGLVVAGTEEGVRGAHGVPADSWQGKCLGRGLEEKPLLPLLQRGLCPGCR